MNNCQFGWGFFHYINSAKRGRGDRVGFIPWGAFFDFLMFLTRYLQHGTKTQVVIECHSPLGAPGLRVAVVV